MTRIALVADRSPHVHAHARVPALIEALREGEGLAVDPYWIATPDAEDAGLLAGFDGIWIMPGSPYRSEAGAITAARVAREREIPFLGTCGGFQHALLEYARGVCGLTRLAHGEVSDAPEEDLLIVPLACSLAGHESAVHLTPGSVAERLLGAESTTGRYHCAYGPSPRHTQALQEAGLRFTGHDDDGEIRVAELPGHPFYLATLFQPELSGDGPRPHPFIRAFAEAATAHAAARL
ncbi:CTP synthase C-terminal region-related (seleno)protein [Bailinhaonella thermotolerans]|uniref:CTP synthase (glutamine hydrolyzing) n=1 Tax=Bailinhaonella thermotolerans TaxID=1070861 RepID=A0A3A4A5A5_9ACTN|nr:hypothetical protein [Bailinhaonella thermotolerans]RJL23061.1 hypothetical protein D5H75_34390 [Bailinhaonella thermotolerans]